MDIGFVSAFIGGVLALLSPCAAPPPARVLRVDGRGAFAPAPPRRRVLHRHAAGARSAGDRCRRPGLPLHRLPDRDRRRRGGHPHRAGRRPVPGLRIRPCEVRARRGRGPHSHRPGRRDGEDIPPGLHERGRGHVRRPDPRRRPHARGRPRRRRGLRRHARGLRRGHGRAAPRRGRSVAPAGRTRTCHAPWPRGLCLRDAPAHDLDAHRSTHGRRGDHLLDDERSGRRTLVRPHRPSRTTPVVRIADRHSGRHHRSPRHRGDHPRNLVHPGPSPHTGTRRHHSPGRSRRSKQKGR